MLQNPFPSGESSSSFLLERAIELIKRWHYRSAIKHLADADANKIFSNKSKAFFRTWITGHDEKESIDCFMDDETCLRLHGTPRLNRVLALNVDLMSCATLKDPRAMQVCAKHFKLLSNHKLSPWNWYAMRDAWSRWNWVQNIHNLSMSLFHCGGGWRQLMHIPHEYV